MIKAAICEDSELDKDILKEIISFLLADRGLEYEINSFTSGKELVSKYKNHPYDIIFLDILMDDIDGIETGRLIREMDDKVEIVYCTSSKDFAIAAYDVHAMGYLLKPYETLRIGAVKVYSKLDAFEEELSDSRFLRCHQSYLVNMQYVAGIVDSDFIMIDDQMIPIRKSGRKLIVKKYEDYLKESLKNH